MSGVRLEWAQFGDFDSFDVIRSNTSMIGVVDANLPSPIATNLKTMYYVDTTIVEGATYYYMVRVWRGSESFVSSEILVETTVDAYWQYVSALLHFDGSDGSIDFTDETGRIWTGLGTPKIKSDPSAFGGSSIFLNGNSSLSTVSSSDFAYGLGDFTWESFVRFSIIKENQYIIDHSNGSGNGGTLSYYNGTLRYYNATIGVYNPLYQTAIPLLVDQRYHIAVERYLGVTTIYVNGVAKASGSDPHNFGNLELWLGRYAQGNSFNFNGYMDELRITKGLARYKSEFEPPDKPFLEG